MLILTQKITHDDLASMAENSFGDMVKGVVDVDKKLLALDAELHADLESMLLENGSKQEYLWGINLYPAFDDEDFVEFDSLINIRPRQNNMGRGVYDEQIQAQIREVVAQWIL